MIYTKEQILEQQAHFKRLGIDYVPESEMIKPMCHLLDGCCAMTASLGAIGIPCGYIGVPPAHPMHGISDIDIHKLDDNLGIVWAGYNPSFIEIMHDTGKKCWYFGVDTGTNLKATRQDIIEHLRLIAEFLNKKDRESKHANTHN